MFYAEDSTKASFLLIFKIGYRSPEDEVAEDVLGSNRFSGPLTPLRLLGGTCGRLASKFSSKYGTDWESLSWSLMHRYRIEYLGIGNLRGRLDPNFLVYYGTDMMNCLMRYQASEAKIVIRRRKKGKFCGRPQIFLRGRKILDFHGSEVFRQCAWSWKNISNHCLVDRNVNPCAKTKQSSKYRVKISFLSLRTCWRKGPLHYKVVIEIKFRYF